jgi:hypothetical protein
MKIWVDDVRSAPEGYVWCTTVNQVIMLLHDQDILDEIELLDLDHDAGSYAEFGGDYIKILDFIEQTGRSYPIRIHSMNPVGVENMRRIIQRNGWTEVR